MNLRPFIVTVALLSSSIVFAQGRSDNALRNQSKKDQQISATSQETVTGSSINTRSFFPQITHTYGTKQIKPENPSIDLSIGSRKSLFNGAMSRTNVPGPTVDSFFPGLNWTGWIPADPDVAVGPNNIVQVVNARIAFFNKTGGLQFSQNSNTFFSGVATTSDHFDPKVIYDRIAQRFVIIFLEQRDSASISGILLAVSDDSNPNGTWHRYNISAKATTLGRTRWLDYPGLGYNKDGYVVNGNLFDFIPTQRTFGGIEFITIPKTPVLSGSPVTASKLFDTSGVNSAQMAETVDPASGIVYGAARTFPNQTRFYALRNVGTSPIMNIADIVVTNSGVANSSASTTGGRFLDTVGPRIFTAIFRNGRMYLSYNHDNGSRVGVRWTELNMGNWPVSGTITELQAGNYTSGSLNYFMPAINVNKHGDISIMFTGSNTSTTSNIVVAGRVSTDPANSMSAPTTLAGAFGSTYTLGRWGDYFGIDVDPVDDETFWGTAMVVGTGNTWTTRIESWTVSKTHFIAPTAFTWLRGVQLSGNLASLANDDGNYNSARAGATLFPGESPAQLRVEATAPVGQTLDIELNVVTRASTPGLGQFLQLWNFSSSQWVTVGSQSATMSDSLQTAVVGGTLSEFIEAGTRKVRSRVYWQQTGAVLGWPWNVSVDQFEWEIRVR